MKGLFQREASSLQDILTDYNFTHSYCLIPNKTHQADYKNEKFLNLTKQKLH